MLADLKGSGSARGRGQYESVGPDRLAELAALLGPAGPASPDAVLRVARCLARSARGGY
ncbi:hypothetical protein AB0945_44425 [Streptomyces sp. NPDC005474]|uniref:hypothetical protein n=1 Tax=Streptomyces sp. NPDC005474 TaxID=3154878 RepID=UPI0034518AC4